MQTKMDETTNSILTFISEDSTSIISGNSTTRIEVSYNTMFSLSKLIRAMVEDDPSEREITIPTFKDYNQDDINLHLRHIINKISKLSVEDIDNILAGNKNVSILKEDLKDYITDPTEVNMYKVPGNIDNLTLYLLLINWLDIKAIFNEIYETILVYRPKINEIFQYMNIADGILYSLNLSKQFLKQVSFLLLENNDPISLSIVPIISRIIDYSEIDLYDRHVIFLKYKLYGVIAPTADIDVITARRLYKFDVITARRLYKFGVESPIIFKEIVSIRNTKDHIVETMTSYGSAVRIAQSFPITTEEGEIQYYDKSKLFWFYIQKKIGNRAYVGDINVNDTIYKVWVECSHLFTVDEFKQKELNQYEDEGDIDYVDNNFYNSQTDFAIRTRDYNSFVLFQRKDSLFRKWLHQRHMLTDFEIVMLDERQKLHLRFMEINSLISNMDQFSWADIQEKDDIEHEFSLLALKLYDSEYEFYLSDEGVRLEKARFALRKAFFEGYTLYDGEVAILDAYTILEVKDNEITIKPVSIDSNKPIFHTIDKEISDITYHTVDTDFDSKEYKMSSKIFNSYQGKMDIKFKNNKSDKFAGEFEVIKPDVSVNTSIYTMYTYDTFKLVDPSTIPNIETVKVQSDPIYTGSSRTILAFPWNNPKIYLESVSGAPIGYKISEDKIIGIFYI